MIRKTRFHCRSDRQRLMDTTEIVIGEPERDSSRMILTFLGKAVCKARETADTHPHRKVLPLNKTSAHMLGVGIADYNLHFAADAGGRGITLVIFGGSAVNFLQLCIVNIIAEALLHGFKASPMSVGGNLYSIVNPAGTILHELCGPS